MWLRSVAVMAAAVVASTAAAHAQTVAIGVSGNVTGLRFNTVSVPIFADLSGAPGTSLGSYTVRVSWNPNILALSGLGQADAGTFALPQINSDSAGSGVAYVTAVSATGRSGVFDLIHLEFFVDSADTSPINVQVLEASAAGTLTNLLPFVVAVSGGFCPGSGHWGDVDHDGFANSRDALAILSSVVGLDIDTTVFNLPLGDVDGDAKVNSRDALIVLSYGVGLPITGTRVLLVAAPGCSVGATTSLKILPDTVDLVRHQSVQLQVVAIGAGGRPVAMNGVNWQVADSRLATIDEFGVVTAVDTGLTTVLASIGPGVTTSAPIVVRARRAVWHVDPHALGATIELGTAHWPYETPELAFPLVNEGDTVRVHPGTVDWRDFGSFLEVGAVLIGDTLPDGTRPVVRGTPSSFGPEWDSGKRAVVANLEFQGFSEVITNFGANNLVLQNVRMSNAGTGLDVEAEASVDTVRISHSRFIDAPVFVESAHVVLLDHNFMRNVTDDALNLRRSAAFDGSVLRSLGDSIQSRAFQTESPEWAFVDMDSVFVDSLWLENPADTALNSGAEFLSRFMQVTNSKFLNLADRAFEFGGNRLIVDKSTFTGCAEPGACDWTRGTGVYLFDDFLGPAGGHSQGSVSLTNSSFFAMEAALESGGSSLAGPVTFSHNTADSVSLAVSVDVDTVAVTDNVVHRIANAGLSLRPAFLGGVVTVLRNQFACAAPGATGIFARDQRMDIEGNNVQNCFTGVEADQLLSADTLDVLIARDTIVAYDSVDAQGVLVQNQVRPTISFNRVTGGGNGMHLLNVINGDAIIDGNVVTQTQLAAILLDGGNGNVTGHFNNIFSNLQDGLSVFCVSTVPVFEQGRFVGNQGFGVITPECSDSVHVSNNWWGLASGAHSGLGSDSVSGSRIATDSALTSDPLGATVPAAPRVFISASTAWSGGARAARPRPVAASRARESLIAAAGAQRLAAQQAAERHAARVRALRERPRPAAGRRPHHMH